MKQIEVNGNITYVQDLEDAIQHIDNEDLRNFIGKEVDNVYDNSLPLEEYNSELEHIDYYVSELEESLTDLFKLVKAVSKGDENIKQHIKMVKKKMIDLNNELAD